ncbi:ThiF family adenylyltransferase [Pseudofrankia sp. BMG5.37]|uniref:ThiF family adenylyltransferase n=1 Tax=Pseudofrankia sp. BMG5.37 TaxID=3050035 RepID=UPI0028952CE6|nr:ThiF family adenylyltransferase [Pseudofrankia sp. BMG5.37]MDT3445441.1 ThiF family adenylyltransferase [Pseudofrankia sp. BMG5.37]
MDDTPPRATSGSPTAPAALADTALADTVITGNNLVRLHARPAPAPDSDAQWHRQAMLFGAAGQQAFARMRVAVVGLGGAGNIITEFLAHLGVGELVLIDDDRVDATNLPRLLAARNARRANLAIGILHEYEHAA